MVCKYVDKEEFQIAEGLLICHAKAERDPRAGAEAGQMQTGNEVHVCNSEGS